MHSESNAACGGAFEGVVSKTSTLAVSESPPEATTTAKLPGWVPAINCPASSTVPPVALHSALPGTLVPFASRRTKSNETESPTSRETLCGASEIATGVPSVPESAISTHVVSRSSFLLGPLPRCLPTTFLLPGGPPAFRSPSDVMTPASVSHSTEPLTRSPLASISFAVNWTTSPASSTAPSGVMSMTAASSELTSSRRSVPRGLLSSHAPTLKAMRSAPVVIMGIRCAENSIRSIASPSVCLFESVLSTQAAHAGGGPLQTQDSTLKQLPFQHALNRSSAHRTAARNRQIIAGKDTY